MTLVNHYLGSIITRWWFPTFFMCAPKTWGCMIQVNKFSFAAVRLDWVSFGLLHPSQWTERGVAERAPCRSMAWTWESPWTWNHSVSKVQTSPSWPIGTLRTGSPVLGPQATILRLEYRTSVCPAAPTLGSGTNSHPIVAASRFCTITWLGARFQSGTEPWTWTNSGLRSRTVTGVSEVQSAANHCPLSRWDQWRKGLEGKSQGKGYMHSSISGGTVDV